MAMYGNNSMYGSSRWSDAVLAPGEATFIKQSYLLLGLSVAAALAGGYFGATSEFAVRFFGNWIGWILALVVINVLPRVALAARHNGSLGLIALVANGAISGLVLAPILALAAAFAPNLILASLLITAAVFLAVTIYVMSTTRTFSPSRGIMTGVVVSLFGAMLLNGFLQIGWLSMLIAAGIGIFGVVTLVYATSQVLRSHETDSPIPGALMLFAGLFNVFVATLNILLAFSGGRSRN